MSKLGAKGPPVNLADIAKAAGISKMTVSRVLRNQPGVSDDTRARVMREVERIGYVQNRLAAAFGSPATSNLVGVAVPKISGGLFAEVVESVDRALARLEYQTVIGTTEYRAEAEEAWLKMLLSWRPAGLILTGRQRSRSGLEMLRHAGIPIVEIWDLNTRPLDMCVGFDHHDCGYEMGRFVAGKDRMRIGYVGALEGDSSEAGGMASTRLAGFTRALADCGSAIQGEEYLNDNASFYPGYYGTETLLSRHPNLDAIYYQNDAMATGGLFYCQSRGIRVPEDLGIAGWGGMEIAAILPKRLTTTRVAARKLGKLAAEGLLARIKGEPVQDVIEAPATLVPGATM